MFVCWVQTKIKIKGRVSIFRAVIGLIADVSQQHQHGETSARSFQFLHHESPIQYRTSISTALQFGANNCSIIVATDSFRLC